MKMKLLLATMSALSIVLMCLVVYIFYNEEHLTSTEVSVVKGSVQELNDETYSLAGQNLGVSIDPSLGPLYGVALANGCTANVLVEDRLVVIHRPSKFCQETKIKDKVDVTKMISKQYKRYFVSYQ